MGDDRQLPYGVADLRRGAERDGRIQCHVKGCDSWVTRPTRAQPMPPDSLCTAHGIFIHPSTYRYEDRRRNLLRPADERIEWYAATKRDGGTRLGHENSEDAVTYNVVRPFERVGSLDAVVSTLIGEGRGTPTEAYFWCLAHGDGVWKPFAQASQALGERRGRGTETDLILYQPGHRLVFVEAKFGSSNEVAGDPARYNSDPWCPEALIDYPSKFDELARNWLVGTYLASQILHVPFWLVSLVRDGARAEKRIKETFYEAHCRRRPEWHFRRATWEGFDATADEVLPESEASLLRAYLRAKTLNLRAAFPSLRSGRV